MFRHIVSTIMRNARQAAGNAGIAGFAGNERASKMCSAYIIASD